jgi:aminoglycoside phosphotransferase (APT) family kinase protein
MIAGPGHGQGDDVPDAALLRAPPPDRTLAWLSRVLGGADVERCDVLPGAAAAAMHLVTVRLGPGQVDRVVLRRYVRPDLLDEEPELARSEATALGAVDGAEVPTPRLLGSDPTGEHTDAPALVMSELPGRPVWHARRPSRWVRALADTAAAIHRVEVPPGVMPAYATYRQRSYAPPAWAHEATTWERAVEIFHGPVPDGQHPLIHRDFHPGNLLWRRGRLTGVVDWASASVGPPSADIGHCRANLLFHAPELADELVTAWEDTTGTVYDRWADIASIIGMLDGLRQRPPSPAGRRAFDAAIERAVHDLAG